jgi:hypothetical protein
MFLYKKTETSSNQPVSVRFYFLGQKPVCLGFDSFWLGFFLVFFRFQFFRFQAYKTEIEPVGFFKILISFFFRFSRFNRFFSFFAHP